MGYWSDRQIQMEDNLYRNYNLNKKVCIECFNNPSLKEFIRENSSNSTGCDYCDNDPESLSCSAADVIEHIYKSLLKIYSDDGATYLYMDGEIQDNIHTTYETDELLNEYGIYSSYEGDIAEAIINQSEYGTIWYETREFNREDEELLFRWDTFKKFIKHKYRFMNFDIGSNSFFGSTITKDQFLKSLSELIKSQNLIRTISTDEILYRARYFSDENPFELKLEEMCGPPVEKSVSSRMSPAGISAFYGAEDLETACKEIKLEPQEKFAFCKFRVKKEIRVVDFSKKITPPCLFNREISSENVYMSNFLRDFIKDLCCPIDKDGKEHFEYSPTQLLSEFLRIDLNVRGIIWPSSVNGNKSYCLFIDREECGCTKPTYGEQKEQILELTGEIQLEQFSNII